MKKILVIVILGTLLVTGCQSDKNKVNNENHKQEKKTVEVKRDGVLKEQKIDFLSFSEVSLKWDGKESEFIAKITNNSTQDVNLTTFDVILKDKSKKEIVTLVGDVNNVLKAGESINIFCYSDLDLSNAYYVEYKKK